MEAVRLFSYSDATQRERELGLNRDQVLNTASVFAHQLVFLSHSSKDHPIVPGVIAFFKTFNADVYVDDFDKRLPSPPKISTALTLKNEIRSLARLVVLVTPNSHTSRWIPWELGLGDGFRSIPSNAVFPITPDGEVPSWLETKDFGLYPRILNLDGKWRVTDPRGGTPWALPDWLHNPIR